MASSQNKTPLNPPRGSQRRNETVAKAEDEPIVDVPPILGMGIVVRVQPELGAIPFQVEHVPVAIRIAIVRSAVHATFPRMLSGMNSIRHRNALADRTKYLHFLKSFMDRSVRTTRHPESRTLWIHGYWIRQERTK